MPIVESFATIVALIGQFKSEKNASEQADFNAFIEWLVSTNHEEIKELLMLNTKATIGIKSILNQDRDILLESMKRIDMALTAFASHTDGFYQLAEAINPQAMLSQQAFSILKQFNSSGASKALMIKIHGGAIYQFLDGDGSIEISEPRFVEDDFQTLVDYGLLRQNFNSTGKPIYIFTRQAANLIAQS
ncbi:MAG: hypothetical protein PHT15_05965 [Gallionellaceae bacterium]|nr:hypothetical protein [Gallionellaceae bacterium]